MTHEEVKKAVNWASQLLQFSLGIKDETKGNETWEAHGHKALLEAREMLASVLAETDKIIAGPNAAS